MEKKNKKKRKLSGCRRFAALTLAAAVTLSAASCGNEDSSGDSVKKEWLYVPEFLTLDEEGVSYYEMQLAGGDLYYISWNWDEETGTSSQDICRYSLEDRELTSHTITWPEEGDQNLGSYAIGQDGSLYAMVRSYSEDYKNVKQYLAKFDAEGKNVFYKEITDRLGEDNYIQNIKVDSEGRLYLAGNDQIWLFDGEGNYKNSISLASMGDVWLNQLGSSNDGKVYISYRSYNGDSRTSVLAEIDFEGGKIGESYEDVPGDNFGPGLEKDFLVWDGNAVYEYDLKKKQKELVLEWLDSDINGNTVRSFGTLEDGRIVAVIEDWENNDNSIALLTKTKAEEVPQKETIVVGTVGGAYNLRTAAVRFNKSSDKYHVTIRSYIDENDWSDTALSDAMTKLNNDITSSNCPDVLDLSMLNISQLSAKGVFEDLNGYLDGSSVVNRADLMENILNAYTIDGKLITIPAHFYMSTIAGRASDLGDKSGWTLDEMIAYADAHPEAELFYGETRAYIMQTLLMFNGDAFVNWATGECRFDTDEFKHLLEFTKRFPEEIEREEGGDSEPTRIQKGEVLLSSVHLSDFDNIQMYPEMFGGEINCIGYPTTDGTGGHALNTGDAYAITTKSQHKEGAWEFIESILCQGENERYWNGFPTRKSELDKMIAEATKVEYVLDENGNPMLDENGEPMTYGSGGGISYEDGWSYTFHIATQEEVDIVLALMEKAKPVSYGGQEEIMKIITEEAEAFFKGQKSVDEVAGIIQSRIKIYVSENR